MNWRGIAVVAIGLGSAGGWAQPAPTLKTPQDKVSYALGVETARNFKRQGIEFDPNLVKQGLQDGAAGERLLLPEAELRAILLGVQNEQMQKRKLQRGPAADRNKSQGEAFLAENQKKPGVITLPSGLQYKILQTGTGRKPTETNTVQIYYRAARIDGTEFLSSKPGLPATFQVKNGFIPALSQVLPLMTAGSKWQLFVPPQLAYGAQGVGRQVPPNATIHFEVELLSVK